MKTITLISAIVLTTVYSFAQAPKSATKRDTTITTEALRNYMHSVWEDNVTLTHNIMLCMVDNQPGVDDIANQLLENQNCLAYAIERFYGNHERRKFDRLLYANMLYSEDLMDATKKGRLAAFQKDEQKWKENANAISVFLNKVNPYWKVNDFRALLYGQIQYYADEATALHQKNYVMAEDDYQRAYVSVETLADMLSDGIIHQFPEKFQEFTQSYGMK